jgi:hypothetical protein
MPSRASNTLVQHQVPYLYGPRLLSIRGGRSGGANANVCARGGARRRIAALTQCKSDFSAKSQKGANLLVYSPIAPGEAAPPHKGRSTRNLPPERGHPNWHRTVGYKPGLSGTIRFSRVAKLAETLTGRVCPIRGRTTGSAFRDRPVRPLRHLSVLWPYRADDPPLRSEEGRDTSRTLRRSQPPVPPPLQASA